MAPNNLLDLLYGQKPSGDAFVGYPAGKKYAGAKRRAEQADVNTLPDPKTYAAVQSFLGTAPDELGFSALHPKREEIRDVADKAYALGLLTNVAPMTKGLPVGASIKPTGSGITGLHDALSASPEYKTMLQGFYRGHAGDYTAGKAAEDAGKVFVTPQRKAADFYANKRAKQTGGEPQVEMVLADPFAGRAYGHSTPGSGRVEPITTQARQLAPQDIQAVTPLEAPSKPVTPDQPFWYNPAGGQHVPFEAAGMHNAVIQDPAYAARLGVTTEEAMQPTSTLLMGRTERKNPEVLNLMQVAPPTPESIEAIKAMLQKQQLPYKTINFSAGENLFEGIPVDELLRAEGLSPLKAYQQYADGGPVEVPNDFTTPDMSDGGEIIQDPEFAPRSPLSQIR